tara:strand:+ start:6124 stop:6876 length:753 start_codon:yes stop_codon:yes gene_type:complete
MKIKRKIYPKKEIQIRNIKNSLQDRAFIEGNIPKTGRSITNYATQLFPDIEPNQLLNYLKNKNYLDLACGVNHMYDKSLLCQLGKKSNNKRRDGLDIHSDKFSLSSNINYYKGLSHKTNLPKNTYDCITINNYLYFWENNTQNLIKIYKELFRILKSGGELRIFPIFYSNYYNDTIELFDLLNQFFYIQCLRPKLDYSKESPIYIQQSNNGSNYGSNNPSEIIQTDPRNGLVEYKLNHELMAQVLILKKI